MSRRPRRSVSLGADRTAPLGPHVRSATTVGVVPGGVSRGSFGAGCTWPPIHWVGSFGARGARRGRGFGSVRCLRPARLVLAPTPTVGLGPADLGCTGPVIVRDLRSAALGGSLPVIQQGSRPAWVGLLRVEKLLPRPCQVRATLRSDLNDRRVYSVGPTAGNPSRIWGEVNDYREGPEQARRFSLEQNVFESCATKPSYPEDAPHQKPPPAGSGPPSTSGHFPGKALLATWGDCRSFLGSS